MLIDGLRLEGVGDCGEEFALECRECDPDGFTSFDRKLGAIMSEPHRTYMKHPIAVRLYSSANPTTTPVAQRFV